MIKLERKKKIINLEEATRIVKSGDILALGGMITSNVPMAFVRSIVRAGIKNLTVVRPAAGGIDADLLIAAKCVKKIISAYVGAECLSPILPNFRAACESGEIKVWESDEWHIYLALQAILMEVPFMPTRVGLGTDIPRLNPDLKEFNDPIKGEKLIAIPAIEPDVAVIHVGQADHYGNGVHAGATFGDRLIAKAAKKVILTTEKIVSNESIRAKPQNTSIPNSIVDAVVIVPYGAHPAASHGYYREDIPHLREYVKAGEDTCRGQDPEAMKIYLEKYVYSSRSHESYLKTIGMDKLKELEY